jgi:hypothetical protein
MGVSGLAGCCHRRTESAGGSEHPLMENPYSHSYCMATLGAFLTISTTFSAPQGQVHDKALGVIEPFLDRFASVLRHYLPDIVGECLALAYDNPELSRTSQQHGFGLYMRAGSHPHDRDGRLGSYRDDGSYLALCADDYLAGVSR